MEKKQILQQALEQLNSVARNEVKLPPEDALFSISGRSRVEQGGAKLESPSLELSYSIVAQPWAPQKDINALISQVKSQTSETILFADFVNPVMAEKFRQRSVSFVDCAGNLSIKAGPLKLYVKGRKLPRLSSRRMRGRAFNAAGLKVIFAIFNQPLFLQASYRDISNKVNIALGSVGPVIDDLYASGYILDDGERRLVNKKRLFERWVDGYLEKLRPKQIMACYTSDDKSWWNNAEPAKFHGIWGGEVVVAKSTPFMEPETISLYFSSEVKQAEFAQYYGLRKDEEGEICVYRTFWSPAFAGDDNEDGISPMIIYADIVDSINPGSWDVAKTFYGETMTDLLQD